jgi:hypothetical protein
MEWPSRAPVVAAALIGSIAGVSTAAAEDGRRVVVLIDNRAEVRPAVLDQAGKHAAGVHRTAGVTMEWRVSEERSDSFTVRLVIQNKFRGTSGFTSKLLMGAAPESAVECGGVAYLFHDQIVAFSNLHQLDPSLVIGIVAAHEIGHVLMRRAGHSAEGIMRASWTPDDWQRAASGFLLFSRSEREMIRSRISACATHR